MLAIIGASLDGFKTTVLPVISAAVVIPVSMAAGKLNGAITPQTPYGFNTLLLFSPGCALFISVTKPALRSISSA